MPSLDNRPSTPPLVVKDIEIGLVFVILDYEFAAVGVFRYFFHLAPLFAIWARELHV